MEESTTFIRCLFRPSKTNTCKRKILGILGGLWPLTLLHQPEAWLGRGASNNTHYIIVCSLNTATFCTPPPWYCRTSFSSSAGLSPGLCLHNIAELLRVCSNYKNIARGCSTHAELSLPCLVLVAMLFVCWADEFSLLISLFSVFWLGNWGASSHHNKNTVGEWRDQSARWTWKPLCFQKQEWIVETAWIKYISLTAELLFLLFRGKFCARLKSCSLWCFEGVRMFQPHAGSEWAPETPGKIPYF